MITLYHKGEEDKNNIQIRGWYMDELENRDAEAFDKWFDSKEESPRKFYL